MGLIKSYIFCALCLIATVCAVDSQNEIKKPQYFLSICAFFQDEAAYLKEWIEYHRLVGVQHFYLFNNNSSDNYQEVLQPYLKNGIVELSDWPGSAANGNWTPDQNRAYEYCIKNVANITEWLAIIDVDEFIVPVDQPDITSYLAQYKNMPKVGLIKINMQLYGTSHLPSLPKDKLMIESLILKAPWDYHTPGKTPDHTVVKSIVRPHAMKYYRIHEGECLAGYHSMPLNTFSGRFQPVQIDRIRLNHYWTRADDFFYNVKLARRERATPGYIEIMLEKNKDLNQVEDTIMERFIPRLKERMQSPVCFE